MFGGKTKACGQQATSPFRARCTRDHGHSGPHSARGLRWGSDGKIKFGARKAGRKR
jgi:hypothetical protein